MCIVYAFSTALSVGNCNNIQAILVFINFCPASNTTECGILHKYCLFFSFYACKYDSFIVSFTVIFAIRFNLTFDSHLNYVWFYIIRSSLTLAKATNLLLKLFISIFLNNFIIHHFIIPYVSDLWLLEFYHFFIFIVTHFLLFKGNKNLKDLILSRSLINNHEDWKYFQRTK